MLDDLAVSIVFSVSGVFINFNALFFYRVSGVSYASCSVTGVFNGL